MKLLSSDGHTGIAEVGGVRQSIDISLVQPIELGQYVIVHAGFAINVLNEEEARITLALFEELKGIPSE